MPSALVRLATRGVMAWHGRREWDPVAAGCDDPHAAQTRALLSIVRANAGTTFGSAHGFAAIGSPREYQDAVPIQQYDTLQPLLDAQRLRREPALTAEPPLFYAQTSGTTGTPKYVPVTRTSLTHHRREQRLFSYLQYRACPAAFDGAAFGIMGAAVEDVLDSGHEVGSISGRLYAELPGVLRRRLVVPPEVADIDAYEDRYRVLLMLALARPDVTYMGSPNPSTFLRLLDVLAGDRERLLDGLATGRSDTVDDLPTRVREKVAPRLRAQPERARALARLDRIDFTHLWPRLTLVTTWTGGSCGTALTALKARLPPDVRVMELGYQATECRGTLPLDTSTQAGLPPLHHHFFEFVEPDSWDAGRPRARTLDELEQGRQYYVVVTTSAGLYRYFMNDLVEVDGIFRRTPLFRFVQKGRGVTNLTGEKLYEAQVIHAVQDACGAHGSVLRFFMLVAREQPAGYHLYAEPEPGSRVDSTGLAADIDVRLRALNIEYDGKCRSGRLAPVRLVPLRPGAGDAYRVACVNAGQRDGQLKPPVLEYETRLVLDLDTERAS